MVVMMGQIARGSRGRTGSKLISLALLGLPRLRVRLRCGCVSGARGAMVDVGVGMRVVPMQGVQGRERGEGMGVEVA